MMKPEFKTSITYGLKVFITIIKHAKQNKIKKHNVGTIKIYIM